MFWKQRWRQIRKSDRTWDSPWLPPTGGVVAGGLLALILAEVERSLRGPPGLPDLESLAPLWAFLLGFVAVWLPLLVLQNVARRLERQVRAMLNIRPFVRPRLISPDAWAMDAMFAEHVLNLVDEGAQHVVELGSGHSTLLYWIIRASSAARRPCRRAGSGSPRRGGHASP